MSALDGKKRLVIIALASGMRMGDVPKTIKALIEQDLRMLMETGETRAERFPCHVVSL